MIREQREGWTPKRTKDLSEALNEGRDGERGGVMRTSLERRTDQKTEMENEERFKHLKNERRLKLIRK